MKLSPWIKGAPLHIGVYERKIGGNGRYSFWNGYSWMAYCNSVDGAMSNIRHGPSAYQLSTPYRGLAKPA